MSTLFLLGRRRRAVSAVAPPSATPGELPAPPDDAGRLVRFAAQSGSSTNSGASQTLPWSLGHALDQLANLTQAGHEVTLYLMGDFAPTSGNEIQFSGAVGTTDTYGWVIRGLPGQPRSIIRPTTGDYTPFSPRDSNWGWIHQIEIDGSGRASSGTSANIENIRSHHLRYSQISSHHATAHGWKCTGQGEVGNNTDGCDFVILEDSEIYECARNSIFGASGMSVIRMKLIGGTAGTDWTHPDGREYGLIWRRNRVWRNGQAVNSTGIGQNFATDGNGMILDRQTEYGYTRWHLIENNVSFRNFARGVHAFRSHKTISRFNSAAYNSQHPRWSSATSSPSGYGEIVHANNQDTGDADAPQTSYGELAISDPTLASISGHQPGATLQNTDDDPQHSPITKYSAVDTAAGFVEGTTVTAGIGGDFGTLPSDWATRTPYGDYSALTPTVERAFHGIDLSALNEWIPLEDNLGQLPHGDHARAHAHLHGFARHVANAPQRRVHPSAL